MVINGKVRSILDRLRNQAREENISFQMVLQLFAQEEFLRRLANSEYAENFILKGGMFIYALTEFHSRPTQDIDFLMRNLNCTESNILNIVRDIVCVAGEAQFLELDVHSSEKIILNNKYPGIRIKFIGKISNIRIPFSADIGIDDVVFPEPDYRRIVTRLSDFNAPMVYTYSLESTIAEKFDAILQRMEMTTRMKDFYDIYFLSEYFPFESDRLRSAIQITLSHRGHHLAEDVQGRIQDFKNNPDLNRIWNSFEPAKDAMISFGKVIDRMDSFLFPALLNTKNMRWNCHTAEWERRELPL